jgi:hypothetical protein
MKNIHFKNGIIDINICRFDHIILGVVYILSKRERTSLYRSISSGDIKPARLSLC